MKIKQGFTLSNIDGQSIIVCDKNINPNFNTSISLNGTSKHLWNLIQNGDVNKEQMLHSLLENFDISTVLALNDIDVFIKILIENGILEE